MGFLNTLFKKNKEEKPVETPTNQYPLEELGKLVGQLIEVYYTCGGEEKAEKSTLKSKPCTLHFYIGPDDGRHIIHWDQKDTQGRRFAVRMIRDNESKIIYENQEVPYNFHKSKTEENAR